MSASIKEVARLAGVSVATVSHVLNNTKNVRPETKKRVEEAIDKLNYQINPIARNLRRGETKIIGFIVSDLSNYYFHDIARGLGNRLLKEGYRPVLIDCKEDKQLEIENIKNLLAGGIDGLIVAPTTEDFSYLNHILGRKKIPIVFVDRRPVGYNGDLVMSENEHGVYVGIKYLIEKGHTKIGFVSSRIDSTMNERLDGYRRAYAEAGLPVNENLIKTGDRFAVSLQSLRHGVSFRQTKELLENEGITAIFTGNLLASVGAFTCLRELEIKVPEEIAFLTFDDSFWLTMTTPSVSAVAQKPEEIGYIAADIICRRLTSNSPTNEPFNYVRLSTELILRESC